METLETKTGVLTKVSWNLDGIALGHPLYVTACVGTKLNLVAKNAMMAISKPVMGVMKIVMLKRGGCVQTLVSPYVEMGLLKARRHVMIKTLKRAIKCASNDRI